MAKGYSVLLRNRNWLFQSVQFVFFPLSFRQVVGSVSILDGGNSRKIKSRQGGLWELRLRICFLQPGLLSKENGQNCVPVSISSVSRCR